MDKETVVIYHINGTLSLSLEKDKKYMVLVSSEDLSALKSELERYARENHNHEIIIVEPKQYENNKEKFDIFDYIIECDNYGYYEVPDMYKIINSPPTVWFDTETVTKETIPRYTKSNKDINIEKKNKSMIYSSSKFCDRFINKRR